MSFVYRYLDCHGDVRYIGMVKGDTLDCLRRRMLQHLKEPGFKSSWRVQFIPNLSRVDADLLESHLIGCVQNRDMLLNKAKLSYGKIEIAKVKPLHWRTFSGGLPPQRKGGYEERCRYYRDLLKTRYHCRNLPEIPVNASKKDLQELLFFFEDYHDAVLKERRMRCEA